MHIVTPFVYCFTAWFRSRCIANPCLIPFVFQSQHFWSASPSLTLFCLLWWVQGDETYLWSFLLLSSCNSNMEHLSILCLWNMATHVSQVSVLKIVTLLSGTVVKFKKTDITPASEPPVKFCGCYNYIFLHFSLPYCWQKDPHRYQKRDHKKLSMLWSVQFLQED